MHERERDGLPELLVLGMGLDNRTPSASTRGIRHSKIQKFENSKKKKARKKKEKKRREASVRSLLGFSRRGCAAARRIVVVFARRRFLAVESPCLLT